MKNHPLPRLDKHPEIQAQLLPFCRLQAGDIWVDPVSGHRVGCIDVGDAEQLGRLLTTPAQPAQLAIHDPPYNHVAFAERPIADFTAWCQGWLEATWAHMSDDASLYVWMGADQRNGFQPLPEFMLMMRELQFQARSFITMRNQRGHGTPKNWMAVRQELLYYTKGDPAFDVQYTDIPKILRGYYKKVNGKRTENLDRSHSDTIRASNVWVDIQQPFYRMEENVNGCYAQKPLASSDRIIQASSHAGDTVLDFFAHSGTTLLSCERLNRVCLTADINPIYCEITIRRLENWRQNARLGWQNSHPFAAEFTLSQTA